MLVSGVPSDESGSRGWSLTIYRLRIPLLLTQLPCDRVVK